MLVGHQHILQSSQTSNISCEFHKRCFNVHLLSFEPAPKKTWNISQQYKSLQYNSKKKDSMITN